MSRDQAHPSGHVAARRLHHVDGLAEEFLGRS